MRDSYPNSDSQPSTAKRQNLSLISLFDSYMKYYASGKGHTARAKKLDIEHFITFLTKYRVYGSSKKLRLSDWDFSSVQRFIDESLSSGEAPATVARRLATLKHMGKILAEQIPGFKNPVKSIKPPRISVQKPKGLSSIQLRRIRNRAKGRIKAKDSFVRVRNEAIFEFMIDTGLRADEVRLLRFGQIDENFEWIRNVRTKGKRYRNVYITSKIRPKLKSYLEAREKELNRFYSKLPKSIAKELPLFISNYNCVPANPESFLMGTKTLWRAINELSDGVDLHPHLLRHAFALDLLDSSHDIRLVSQALGHSDVRITMRYTERRDEEVAEALEKSRRRS